MSEILLSFNKKTLDELDSKKGIGLIERVRLGLGKPNIIYVKDFMSIIAVKENDLLKSKNLTSEVKDFNLRSKENELQEVKTLYPNYIDNNIKGRKILHEIFTYKRIKRKKTKTYGLVSSP